METSPVLARRVIPLKERLEKALAALLVTAIAVAGAWLYTGVSLDSNPVYLGAFGLGALLGVSIAIYFFFKKEEGAHTKEHGRFVRRRIEDERTGRSWLSRIGYNIRRFLSGLVVLIGILVALSGLGVLGLQIFGYLKIGDWKRVSLLSVVSPQWPWLNNPQSWFGLNNIVKDAFDIMPLSLTLILIGWFIAGFGSALRERIAKRGRY
jgi:hypothetical protein